MSEFAIKGFTRLAAVRREIESCPGRIAYIAGGTDFINQLRQGNIVCDKVVDLSQVRDLDYIRSSQDGIHIGAATPFSRIAASGLIRQDAACLAQAATQVGSVQIRNRATIGGNLAGASPAADCVPALAALDASVCTFNRHGVRRLSLSELNAGIGLTGLLPNELITEVVLPRRGWASAFGKVGTRSTVTIARLNMAITSKSESGIT